jgi:hypothetical protein
MVRRKVTVVRSAVALAILSVSAAAFAQPTPTLKIGVTLHPYFSWTKNVVGDLPGAGAVDLPADRCRRYQPRRMT